MKILCVIDNLGSGGAQRQMVMLATELKKRGYDISFFTYYPQDFFRDRLDGAQIPIIFSPKKNKLGLSVIKSLIKTYRSEKPDIVISFLDTPDFYSALAKKFFKGKIKLITSERSATDFRKKSLMMLIKRFSHCQADHIVTNSRHEKNAWEKHYPGMTGKVSCIYNGVDLNRFSKKERFDFTFKLLCIGSISLFKNGLFVIEVLKILRNKYQLEISITWVGRLDKHIGSRGEYFIKMEKQIMAYKLEEFWEWKEPTENIVDLMHSHDALIHAALIEGLPNVVCEALACGMPVFVSNVLDHPLLVTDGVNGFLLPVDDLDTAAKKIAEFYSFSEERITNLSREERDFASNQLSIDKMVTEYMNLFNTINGKVASIE